MRKRILVLLLAVIALFAVAAYAESTITTGYFNVASLIQYTLTLPGQGAVTGTQGGAATADVEFNSSTGNNSCVNAKVVGGTTQQSGTPIFSFDNTGTVNLNLTINISSAMPSCMTLYGKTAWAADCTSGSSTITNANTSIATGYTPAAAAQAYYLWTTFNACASSDATTRSINTGAKAS